MDIKKIAASLPPIFGRSAVDSLLPGIISSKTLANLANRGEGPRYTKMDRHCVYDRDDFLEWLQSRGKLVSTREQGWAEGE